MATFSTAGKAPGVYIQEITLPGPIQGVGTNVAAFVGPAQSGPLLEPTPLTNINQFRAIFGSYIEVPYRVFAAHAVNGFFAEGGTRCYFVRVGNGKQAWRNLLDKANLSVPAGTPQATLVARAQEEGTGGNSITVKVDDAHIASTKAVKPQATPAALAAQTPVAVPASTSADKRVITVTKPTDATSFSAGDVVHIEQAANKEDATIASVSVTVAIPASTSQDKLSIKVTNAADAAAFSSGDLVTIAQGPNTENATIANISMQTITFQAALANSYNGGTIAKPSLITFRPALANSYNGGTITKKDTLTVTSVADAAGFFPGDTVAITQGATTENATIASISGATITFQAPLTNTFSGGTILLALTPGALKIRVDDPTGLEPGSYVSISDGAQTEYNVVRLVNAVNNVVTLTTGLKNTYDMTPASSPVTIRSMEFTLTIVAQTPYPKAGTEIFQNLAMDPRHSHYFASLVSSQFVELEMSDPPSTTPPPLNIPDAVAATNLAGGVDDDLKTLSTADYHAGIDALRKFSDVNLLCVPDCVATSPTSTSHFQAADTHDIQAYMIAHCEHLQDRFAILDCLETPSTDITYSAVQNQRQSLNSDNGYGALYFPWVLISSPFGKGQIAVPPSGHIAGVFANNDNNFGVYKAPANEDITSALAVEVTLSDDEQGPLNDLGINVIRSFPFEGIKIWGARTIAPPDITAWRFVNVRRLLIFLEKSIQKGTRFAVFEPNNLTLWQQIKRLVTDFLMGQWEEGALFGDTPDKAFRVRVDETLNPPDVTALGQLIVQVTVRPTTPAEFIIFQVVQDITGATLQESTTA